jgi:hypothetical protein
MRTEKKAEKKPVKREADVPIYVYATRGEADALDKIVQAWAAKLSAEKDVDVPATRRAWFRDVVKREARAYGVEVTEPDASGAPTTAKPKRK